MLLPLLPELPIIAVADRGVPNMERIILRPAEAIELARYGLCLAVAQPNGMVLPLTDNFFWFGDLVVQPPSWLFLYTGPGQRQISSVPQTGELALSFHWGRPTTMLNDARLVPCVFRFDGIAIGREGG